MIQLTAFFFSVLLGNVSPAPSQQMDAFTNYEISVDTNTKGIGTNHLGGNAQEEKTPTPPTP